MIDGRPRAAFGDRGRRSDVHHGRAVLHDAAGRHTRHLRLGIGAAHRVGVDHRETEMGRRHQWLDAVATANLERHDGAEPLAQQRLLNFDGTGDVAAVGQPLLTDERRPHVGDDRDPVIVGQLQRRHQLDPMPLGIEAAHVEQPEIGAAAASGAEDPGADRQRLDVVERQLPHHAPIS